MEIRLATKLFKQKLLLHNINDWKIRYTYNKIILANVDEDKKVINISSSFVKMNNKKICTNLILHEIAHILVGAKEMHNEVWKQKCREIGAEPNEFIEKGNFP